MEQVTNGGGGSHQVVKVAKGGKNVFVYEDKEYHSSMLDSLNMLRKNRQFCDVILQVGTNQDIHEIYAHKVVLSSASPYFLEMFSNDMINCNGSSVPSSAAPMQYRMVANNAGVLNHAGNGNGNGGNGNGKKPAARAEFDAEAFDQIIDYSYTARLEIPAEKVREVYAIATRLKMTSVAAKCGQFLLSTLTPDNCLEVRNMKAVLKDPFLLQAVDGYLRQNFEAVVQSSFTNELLLHLKVDFLLTGSGGHGGAEEKVNERHLFNEVIEWIRDSFEAGTLDMTTLSERKMFMLFYNKALNAIQDCSEMNCSFEAPPNGSGGSGVDGTDGNGVLDSEQVIEAIEDYKKLSKRLSNPTLIRSASSSVDNIISNGGSKDHNNVSSHANKASASVPSKPRQFLFARSDSESSLSSIADNDDEQEWKVLGNCRLGESTSAGLVTIAGQLTLITMKLRISGGSGGAGNGANGVVNGSGVVNGNGAMNGFRAGSSSKEGSLEADGGAAGGPFSEYCLIPPMSSPRCAVGTAELGGKLFVCGGYDRGECLKTCEVYDTERNKWETLQHMQVPRGRFAIAVANGNVYAVGGCDGQNELNSAEFYDSITLKWQRIQSAPVVRSNAGVCSMNSKIFVIGGWSGNRGLTRCDMYDPDVGKWSQIGDLHTGRYQTGVCMLNDVIYAVGGCDSWSCLNSVEAYVNGEWKLVGSLQTARRGCGVATYNGKIYAVGGSDGVQALCSVEVYDPAENRWSFGRPMTAARANVGVAVVGNRMYAVGGFNGKTFLNTVEYFDFETEEWTTSVAINRTPTEKLVEGGDGTPEQQHDHGKYNNNNNTETNSEYTFNGGNSHNKNNNNNGNGKPMRNSLSSEPLVEVEETIVGH